MKEFTFRVSLGGDEYLGRGRSKKLAKQAAASNALRAVYGINLSLGNSGGLGELAFTFTSPAVTRILPL